MYSGTAMKYKAKDPKLMGDTYGLARNMAGVSNKVLLSMKESMNIENSMGSVIVGKKYVYDRN